MKIKRKIIRKHLIMKSVYSNDNKNFFKNQKNETIDTINEK